MWILIFLGILCSVFTGDCRPNGAPNKSCFYMTPRHIHPHTMRKVFPTSANGLYNITTSSDIFRPDKPIRVTLWGPPFKGFLIAAAEEGAKDWPTGVFFSDDGSANRMNCLGHGDTATHVNNSYKDSVSFLWYGPDSMTVEQVRFVATVVVNVSIYYTNIKSNWLRVDPSLPAKGTGDAAGVTADPWLLGNEQSDPWGTGQGGSSWGTGQGGSSWGGTGTGGSSWGTGTGNQWGSGTGGNTWGSGTGNQWGGGTGSWGTGSGTGSQWNWGNQGTSNQGWGTQGTGTGSTWNWNNQGQNAGKSTATGSGSGQWGGSGSNWNWGQTTTAAWDTKTRAWEATTATPQPATQAPAAVTAPGTGTGGQAAAGGTGGQAEAGGTGAGTGAAATDTKQSSIDWIKNIPTQTWYEILRRLGFNVDSTAPAAGAKKSAAATTTV